MVKQIPLDVQRALRFVIEDKEGPGSIVLGGLVLLLPLVGPIGLLGYMLETARNVAAGQPRPLPTWKPFPHLFKQGLHALALALLYQVPVIVLLALLALLPNLSGLLAGLLTLLALVGSLLLALLTFAAWGRYVQQGRLRAALNVGAVLALLGAQPLAWLLLLGLALACSLGALLGTLLLVVGALFTTFYAQAVFGHALGQVLALVAAAPGQTTVPAALEPTQTAPEPAPLEKPEEPAAAQQQEG